MTTFTDAHTHVISTDFDAYPRDPIGGKQSTWSEEHPVDVDGLLAAMDAAGVAQAVAVQASTVYGHDNRYLAASVAAHRDRLVGVYSLDAMAPDAVATIQRWQEAGLNGFRLFTTGTTMPGQADWLGHPDSYPAWAYAEEHGIPVCLQMTIDGIPALQKTLERYPGSRVVLDHCARPDLSDGAPYRTSHGLFDLAAFDGVHLKLTHRAIGAAAKGASTVEAFLDALLSTYGSSRLMWGSNFPAADGSLASLVKEGRESLAFLDDADAANVFGGTVRRFYAMAEASANV
ncbi:amidohydrolase family protein [Frondihabitans australicus]|uniref:Putative TIM-barrel fold metal-dependent hydrolase n=1 Tax=Frondihabitans australicus TaxID=386892 RepID=A0A495IBQ0_9MICO|nr:amidohydrolase family protein [Frondihabitans australicus]RKR73427.1 putative TIM-barrel fold metal-dependent hydrolase [Frondihabitans australicus]